MLNAQLDRDVTILLVDDDDVDAMSIQRTLKKQNLSNPLVRAHDGVEGLELLRRLIKAGQRYIVLLDINMPRMNGFEMLTNVRADPTLASSLIFMLTTSQAEDDKAKCYQRNVAGFIVKKQSDNGFARLISMLHSYWGVVELPDC
ncbi:MAG TPA: response regulator [Cellvibrionaceae bacterium]|nr:response regulator [Cellvibrionaceae bacterium]